MSKREIHRGMEIEKKKTTGKRIKQPEKEDNYLRFTSLR